MIVIVIMAVIMIVRMVMAVVVRMAMVMLAFRIRTGREVVLMEVKATDEKERGDQADRGCQNSGIDGSQMRDRMRQQMQERDGVLVCPLHGLTGCIKTETILPNPYLKP